MNLNFLEGKSVAGLRMQVFVIITLGAIAYAASFQVPFYFDDFQLLINPDFVGHKGLGAVWHREAARALTYSTFYANYLLNVDHPWGYHFINLLCHLATASTLLLLMRALASTPRLAAVNLTGDGRYQIAAVVAAFVFVLHPLNTQAVTYIVQRAAELAALFYLLALFAYVRAQLIPWGKQRVIWLIVCAGATFCAMLSKQNAATLPLSLLLVELVFFPASRKRLVLLGGGILLAVTVVVLAVTVATAGGLSLEALDYAIGIASRETVLISWSNYLAMQMQVLWHYIRLFGLPLGLHLEYTPPLATTWVNAPVIIAAVAHLAVLGSAFFFVRRSPLPAFGILFYYIAHMVESSVIPIYDIVAEHRTYLPNVGLCMVFGWLAGILYARYPQRRKVLLIASSVVFTILLVLTVQRNLLWRDPVAFFEENTRLAPGNVRAWGQLATAHIDRKNYAAAYGALRKVDQTKLNDNTREKYYANLVIALTGMDKPEEAIRVGKQVMDSKAVSSPLLRSVMLNNMAVSYAALGLNEQAMDSLEESLRLNPGNEDVIRNYALMKNAGFR